MKMNNGMNGILRLFLVCTACISIGVVVSVMIKVMVKEEIAHAGNKKPISAQRPSDLDIIILDNKVYHKDRKGPVKFSHRRHSKDYKVSCWDCHHIYENGKNIYLPWGTTDKCIKCHSPLKKQEKAVKLQAAYHLSCKKCHKKLDIYKGEPRAYKKCTKCHEKNKSENDL